MPTLLNTYAQINPQAPGYGYGSDSGSGTWGQGGWGTAAVGAAGQLAGAYIQSRANNNATKASLASTLKGIAFEKEKEAQRRAAFEQAYSLWASARQQLMSKYGIDPQAAGMGGLIQGGQTNGGY